MQIQGENQWEPIQCWMRLSSLEQGGFMLNKHLSVIYCEVTFAQRSEAMNPHLEPMHSMLFGCVVFEDFLLSLNLGNLVYSLLWNVKKKKWNITITFRTRVERQVSDKPGATLEHPITNRNSVILENTCQLPYTVFGRLITFGGFNFSSGGKTTTLLIIVLVVQSLSSTLHPKTIVCEGKMQVFSHIAAR